MKKKELQEAGNRYRKLISWYSEELESKNQECKKAYFLLSQFHSSLSNKDKLNILANKIEAYLVRSPYY